MRYRPELDGLRAIAIVPVIFYHGGVPGFSGGFVGVDVFFVISGYLITSLILAEKERGNFSLLRFYERRVRRLIPALTAVIISCLPVAWLFLLPTDMKDFSQSVVAVNAFASNFLFAYRSGYFDTSAALKPLLHTWSLAVEEQYYIFYPGALMLLWPLGRRNIAIALSVGIIASLLAAQANATAHPAFTFYLLPTRAWELLLGSLISILKLDAKSDSRDAPHHVICETAASSGIVAIVWSVFSFDGSMPYPSVYTLAPTMGAALVIVFAKPNTTIGRLLGTNIPVGVGVVSYSAYLIHQPLLAFARYVSTDELSNAVRIGLACATFVFAHASWKWIECPFRAKNYFTRQQVLVLAGFSTATLTVFGLAGHLTNGFAERSVPSYLPTDYFQLAAPVAQPTTGVDGHSCISESATICRINYSRQPDNVLLVGDSHAADYSNEFRRYVTEHNLNGWESIHPGCGLLSSLRPRQNGACGAARDVLLQAITERKFSTILLVADYSGYISDEAAEHRARDIEDLTALLTSMRRSGARVLFFVPRYTLTIDPMRAAYLGKENQIHVLKSQINSSQLGPAIAALSKTAGLSIFDERAALTGLGCGSINCFNGHTRSLQPLYRDTNHLTSYGAKLLFQRAATLLR